MEKFTYTVAYNINGIDTEGLLELFSELKTDKEVIDYFINTMIEFMTNDKNILVEDITENENEIIIDYLDFEDGGKPCREIYTNFAVKH